MISTDVNESRVSGTIIDKYVTDKVSKFTLRCRQLDKHGEPIDTQVPIVGFGNTKEIMERYEKGQRVLVFGVFNNSSYTDKEGNKQFVNQLRAFRIFPGDSMLEVGRYEEEVSFD